MDKLIKQSEQSRREALGQDLANLESLLSDIEQSLSDDKMLSRELVDRIREIREMCRKEREAIASQSSDTGGV